MVNGSARPEDFETLKRLVATRTIVLPTQMERVGRLAFERPHMIAFGTLQSIARDCAVSGHTVSRLANAFGFDSFKEFRTIFRNHLASLAA